ncbi:MAG: hypothetical protein AAFZ18_06995 [Myxococcota bacterium]
MRASLHAYGLTAGVVLLVLSPLGHGQDGFPLSTYPMFSSRRPEVATLARAVGATSTGEPVPLSPSLVSGSSEPMQAVSTVNRTIRAGKPASERLCQDIAKRVADAKPEAREIRIELVDVHVEGWFAGERAPRRTRRIATCPVPGSSD